MDGETYMRRHQRFQLVRAVMYGLLVAAGAIAMRSPSDLVEHQVGAFQSFFWSLMLCIGGVLSLYGALTDRWIGEFTGLPATFCSLGVYGGSALAGSHWSPSPLFAYGLVVISFGIGLLARWYDVREEKRRSEEQGSEDKTGG